MRLKSFFCALVILFATAAFGLTPIGAEANDDLRIKVLSNRADLISGGNALVEVVIPIGVNPEAVRVTVNGQDVTDAFAVRGDGRFYGLINGLNLGANEVMARVIPTPTSPSGRTPGIDHDHQPPDRRPGLLRCPTAAVDLCKEGRHLGYRHGPGNEPERDRDN